jgi:hypothetical protein
MTKRILTVVGILALFLATNLSLRVPEPTAAQATCPTGVAPAFVPGLKTNVPGPGGGILKDGDLFYLKDGVKFITSSAGASFFNITEAGPFGIYPGYAGTTSLGFAATKPSATSTAISCLDSFWDIGFNIAGTGATAGDVISVYFRSTNGADRQNLAVFTVQPDSMSVGVNSYLTGLQLSANGHVAAVPGTLIPYSEGAGSSGKRSSLITIALPMNAGIRDCNQLAVEVVRAGGTGTTTVALVNLRVSRMEKAGDSSLPDKGVFGTTGGYPTGLKCDSVCPACDIVVTPTPTPTPVATPTPTPVATPTPTPVPTPTPLSCDLTICYKNADTWCNLLQFSPYNKKNFQVSIPGVNSGQAVRVFDYAGRVSTDVKYALGCSGFDRNYVWADLTSAYVAAQLDVQNSLSFWWVKIGKQQIGCHLAPMMAMPGMPAMASPLPLTLSNGVTLTQFSSLEDLFDATEWAVSRGTIADQQKLLAVYKALNTCHRD